MSRQRRSARSFLDPSRRRRPPSRCGRSSDDGCFGGNQQRSYGRPIARLAPIPVLVALAGLLALGAAAGCGDDGPAPGAARAAQVRTAASGAALDPEVVDLLADAAAVEDATYRVVYEVAGDGAAADAEPNRVEYRQRPPRRRLDVTSPDGSIQSTISDGATTWGCTFAIEWSCAVGGDAAQASALDTGVVQRLTDALVAGASSYEFTVEPRDLLGEPARCLVTRLRSEAEGTPGLAGDGELCIAADGAVLLARTAGGTLRAADHGADLADDAFDLPAPAGP